MSLTIDHEQTQLPAMLEPTEVRPIDPATAFLPVPWRLIDEAAALISTCPGLVPQFREADNCRFVAYQAARWGMDPIAVASKTYFTERKGGGLIVGYEAQLVHALIESSPDLEEPLDFTFGYSNPNAKTAGFRFCKVAGKLRGAAKVRVLTTPTVSQIKVKRSPLWFADPDQQLSYYGARAWARRFMPGRLLGVYSRDEIESLTDAEQGPRRPLFEEDEPGFDTIEPTEADGKHFDAAERKANGQGDARDTRDDGPPASDETSEPADIAEIRAWVETQRAELVALTDPVTLAARANDVVKDKRFRRLIAYAPADATRFDKSIKNRLGELEAQ